jgi:hypothetical protein
MVHRLGYDKRALLAQTVVAMIVLLLSYFFGGPRENINWVYGFGAKPQTRVPALWFLAFLIVTFPLAIYLPTHFVLETIMQSVQKVQTVQALALRSCPSCVGEKTSAGF